MNDYKEIYRKYIEKNKNSSYYLVRTIEKFRVQYEKQIPVYEITITAKKQIQQMSIMKQYTWFKHTIENIPKGFRYMFYAEFHDSGALHMHGLIQHNTGYEIHLRQIQDIIKKKVGRTSISQVKSFNYFGYILKDQPTGLKPIVREDYGNSIIEAMDIKYFHKHNNVTYRQLEGSLDINHSLDPLDI